MFSTLRVEGEVVGTWRRSAERVTIQTRRRLSRAERAAVEVEAASLPNPEREVMIRWER